MKAQGGIDGSSLFSRKNERDQGVRNLRCQSKYLWVRQRGSRLVYDYFHVISPPLVGEPFCLAMPRPTPHAPRANGELVKVGKGFVFCFDPSKSPSFGERLVKDALSPPKSLSVCVIFNGILRYVGKGEM